MIGLAHAAMACNSIQTANNGETPMTHCHNSSAAARHAHELGMLDARDEEIERIQNSLLDDMPEWAKDDGAVIDAAWRKAVEILEERQNAI